jgi:hypothetical protein
MHCKSFSVSSIRHQAIFLMKFSAKYKGIKFFLMFDFKKIAGKIPIALLLFVLIIN